jgi:hypothetical protein
VKKDRWSGLLLAGLCLGLATLSGCQTWTVGMTLPSPRYLEHPPQYFPKSPPFPLSRELAAQERAAAAARGDVGGPPPLPDAGGAAGPGGGGVLPEPGP